MAIWFSCSCGQQLSAHEEYSGRKVTCTVCGEVCVVPGDEGGLVPEESAQLIQFTCECGKRVQAEAAHAGRLTRCPQCDGVLTIPSRSEAEEESTLERGPDGQVTVSSPFPGSPPLILRAAADEVIEEDLEEQTEPLVHTTRKRTRGRSRRWIWMAVGVLALLMVGGAVWFLRQGRIDEDLKLVPQDAVAFITVRVADSLNAPAGKRLQEKLKHAGINWNEDMADSVGIPLAEMERLTMVIPTSSGRDQFFIITTLKPYERPKVLDKVPEASEVTHEGKKYHKGSEDRAVYFVTERILVVGREEGIKECIEAAKKSRSGPMKSALKLASEEKYHLVAAVTPAKVRGLGFGRNVGEGDGIDDDLNHLRLACKIEEGFTFELEMMYSEAASAKKTVEKVEELKKDAKEVASTFFNENPFARGNPEEPSPLVSHVEKFLRGLEAKQSDATARIEGGMDGPGVDAVLGVLVTTEGGPLRFLFGRGVW